MKRIFPAAALLVAATLVTAGAAEADYAWVQLGPGRTAIIRTITATPCAQIDATLGSDPLVFGPRPGAIVAFGDRGVCQANIDLSQSPDHAIVAGARLKLPVAAPSRVVVIGDTGCREEHRNDPAKNQTCADPDWIFGTVAQAALATNPGLVIHVGDFVYRWNCSSGTEGCAVDYQLRNWGLWEADFFKPARPLLAAAPWVFVRGNHEDCQVRDRGWVGWSLFFDHGAPDGSRDACAAAETGQPDYTIALPNPDGTDLTLYLRDSANEIAPEASDFALPAAAAAPVWILTHVPLWSLYSDFPDALPAPVSLVLSGHEHLFEIVQRSPKAPVQIVEGASGTKLETGTPQAWTHDEINSDGFSFVVLDRVGPAWTDAVDITLCLMQQDGATGGFGVTTAGQWEARRQADGTFSLAPPRVTSNLCSGG